MVIFKDANPEFTNAVAKSTLVSELVTIVSFMDKMPPTLSLATIETGELPNCDAAFVVEDEPAEAGMRQNQQAQAQATISYLTVRN